MSPMHAVSANIAVIGAGPAGSFAAARLARAGLDVCLIERQRFPRDKVCGECLSALGIEVLHRHRLHRVVDALRPAVLTHVALVDAAGGTAVHALPRPMWGLTRRQMDLALRDAAVEAGARLLQPVRVESVAPPGPDRPGGRQRLRCRDADNRCFELEAALVLLADGKAAFAPEKPPTTGDLGVKFHLTGVTFDPHTVALFTLDGHYGGLAPVEAVARTPVWNVAMSVPERRVRAFAGKLEQLWADVCQRQPWLAGVARDATLVTPPLACPLPRFAVQPRWREGQIPIGNAAAALEPIGGEGMGLALRSAELATDAVLAAVADGGEVDFSRLRAEYRRLWRLRRPACRAVAMAMSSPPVSRRLVPLSRVAPAATAAVLRLMGKASA